MKTVLKIKNFVDNLNILDQSAFVRLFIITPCLFECREIVLLILLSLSYKVACLSAYSNSSLSAWAQWGQNICEFTDLLNLSQIFLYSIKDWTTKGRCNYGLDIFQIKQPDYFLLEVKTITKIARKWDCWVFLSVKSWNLYQKGWISLILKVKKWI